MKQIPMTVLGADKLREELDYLNLSAARKLLQRLRKPANTVT